MGVMFGYIFRDFKLLKESICGLFKSVLNPRDINRVKILEYDLLDSLSALKFVCNHGFFVAESVRLKAEVNSTFDLIRA